MSTYALPVLPDDHALAAQAARLRRAHAAFLDSLALPIPVPSATKAQTHEFRALEMELAAVEARLGVVSALARAAERAARDAASLLGLRFRWLERRAIDADLDVDAEQAAREETPKTARERRGRKA